MVNITKVWLVTLNRDEEDAGIGGHFNMVNLTVNIDGVDLFENDHTVSSKRGCGAIVEGFPEPAIGQLFDSNLITNSSIRLGMRQDDAWMPEHILVLGITAPPEGQSRVFVSSLKLKVVRFGCCAAARPKPGNRELLRVTGSIP